MGYCTRNKRHVLTKCDHVHRTYFNSECGTFQMRVSQPIHGVSHNLHQPNPLKEPRARHRICYGLGFAVLPMTLATNCQLVRGKDLSSPC
jgi:hypothetical protein